MSQMRLYRVGRSVRWLPYSDDAPAPRAPTLEAPAPSSATVVELPDPADMTVAQVLAWIEAHPDLAEAIKALEADGKARKTILTA